MKVAIIADSHIGKGNDSGLLLDNCERFFTKVFFPYVKAHGIDTVYDLGDTFDRRKYSNHRTTQRAQRFFIDPMREATSEGAFVHMTGNHETWPHQQGNELNTWQALFGGNLPENFVMVNDEPVVNGDCTFMPWLSPEVTERSLPYIDRGNRYLFAHLEFAGFETSEGIFQVSGMDHRTFSKFDRVYSGHFHRKSERDNVTYVGSTGQYTWADYGDQRGFHVLDLDSGQLDFVPNPYESFKKVFYDDGRKTREQMLEEASGHSDKFVKLVVTAKSDPSVFDSVIDAIEASTSEVTVVDDHMRAQEVEIDVGASEDTMTILRNAAQTLPASVDRVRVTGILEELYVEATSLDGR